MCILTCTCIYIYIYSYTHLHIYACMQVQETCKLNDWWQIKCDTPVLENWLLTINCPLASCITHHTLIDNSRAFGLALFFQLLEDFQELRRAAVFLNLMSQPHHLVVVAQHPLVIFPNAFALVMWLFRLLVCFLLICFLLICFLLICFLLICFLLICFLLIGFLLIWVFWLLIFYCF